MGRRIFKMLHIRRHGLLRICVGRFSVLAIILIPFLTLGNTATQAWANRVTADSDVAPLRLDEAVGCLVAADYIRKYGLPYVGLQVGEWARVRYAVGSIPGIGDTPGIFNVVFYSRAGNRGILLFADPRGRDSFLAVYNGYHLHRNGPSWSADYGNGGFHLYQAVGRFVTKLSKSPLYRVFLTPGGERCITEKL